MPFCTQSEFDTFARRIHALGSRVTSLSRSKLNEALARGCGFRTYASLRAALKQGPLDHALIFNYAAFMSRLACLEDWTKASMLSVIVEGHTFDIEINKWPAGTPRRNGPLDQETSYHLVMRLLEVDGTKAQGQLPFSLPVFAKTAREERFLVDSGYAYRVTEGLYSSRFRKGVKTLRAIVTDGLWGGEVFIYGLAEQMGDSLTLKAIKSAVVKCVLPTVSKRVVCVIYHPDSYDPNARRIEISLGTEVLEFLGSTALHFQLPELPERFFVMDDKRSNTERVGVIVDGFWGAAVNSNGVDEADNKTSLEEVRVRTQIAVETSLSLLGFSPNRN